MNFEEIKCNVDHVLSDRGLTVDYKEQAVRQLLYHLYIAIDIYRYMTFSEKNKAGFWYRTFKSSYRLTGFLKERKRKRDKEKSPLHPSYKERETEVKEKVNEKTGKMRFEEQRYWNTERRLKRWMNTSYSADNSAAALRLKRTQKKQASGSSVAEQQAAAKRAEDNARLEQEIRERKAGAVSYEEYLKMTGK